MELAAVKGLLRAALEIIKELDIKYCAAIVVLQQGAKPKNPNDGSLEQQVQSVIDDPENKRLADDKYNRVFVKIAESLDDRELSEFLQHWKPEGPLN
jgi:hypothetical protein